MLLHELFGSIGAVDRAMSSSKIIEAMRPHRRVEVQVPPAPATLSVVHDMSRKIQKPPRGPSASSSSAAKAPVIIYMVSPKVIHVDASEFMPLVQRLTGPVKDVNNSESTGGGGGHGAGGGGGVRELHRPLPVKVKASRGAAEAALKGSGHDEHQFAAGAVTSGVSPTTLYFHDLSPPAFGVRKDGAVGSSPPSWLLHGDYLDQSPRYQSDPALVSSSSFLDMLGLPDR